MAFAIVNLLRQRKQSVKSTYNRMTWKWLLIKVVI